MDEVDYAEMICHLRNQVESLNETVGMLERGHCCIEVIKRNQTVQISLHNITGRLLNNHLEACISSVMEDGEDHGNILSEISTMYCYFGMFRD